MKPLTITGARTLVKINGELFAAGYVLDYTIETAVTVIDGIDNVLPNELAPERITVSMSMKVYRTPENDPVTMDFAPRGDNALDDPQKGFTQSSYISIEIRDRITDKTVIFLPRAWITKHSGSMEAEGILSETWHVKSIGFTGPGAQTSSIFGVIGGLFT
jgi:hypothetical protein